MAYEGACPLCAGPQKATWEQQDFAQWVTCPICGFYGIDTEFIKFELEPGNITKEERELLVIAARNHIGKPTLRIRENNYEQIINDVRIPTLIDERVNLILMRLTEPPHKPGDYVQVNVEVDYPKFYCRTKEEFRFFVKSLEQQGHVQTHQTPPSIHVTVGGLREAQKLATTLGGGRLVFTAMSFAPEHRDIFDKGIFPAAEKAGYIAERVDRIEHVDLVDDKIIAMLRSCAFVIADFTANKRGVYFEAGFALGEKKKVFWLCKDDAEERKELHFDTEHRNFIFWKDYDDLRERLYDRIVGVVGRYERK